MVLEYILVLVMTVLILTGSFGMAGGSKGPMQMFETNAPKLANRLERRSITGYGFFHSSTGRGVQWKEK